MGSESARDLAQLLGCVKVRPDGNYRPKVGHKVINWGLGRNPEWVNWATQRQVSILNKPSAVNIAGNKLATLEALKAAHISVPVFTTDRRRAQRWLDDSETVVERHELRGNSGAGIRIVHETDDAAPFHRLSNAPLYTKFIHKTNEFRVHIFNGKVIDYIEKKRMTSDRRPENFSPYISSVNMGWVFSRTGVRDLPEVKQIALRAVKTLGLDFGAVDIVYADGRAYVLEVNTAPGLSGTTLVNYANAIRRYMGAADLPVHVTNSIMDRVTQNTPTARPVAAHVAQADRRTSGGGDLVTLTIDRATALKLKSLLASL